MAVFDIVVNPPEHVWPQGDAISERYFTIDTADMITVHEWLKFNGHILIYAFLNNEVIGFYNLMPLTEECGKLFERQAIKEEDLGIEHILPHEALPYAQYAYLSAVAIRDLGDYVNHQCAVAMLSIMASHLLNGYNDKHFKRLYVNPTTFQGNRMVRRLGLRPVKGAQKSLGENDIYAVDMNPENRVLLTNLQQRYARFVRNDPWLTKEPLAREAY